MDKLVKSSVVAVGLLLLIAPLVATAQPSEVSTATPKPDVNKASRADLVRFPDIGAGTAQRIIAGRPYTSVVELEKSGQSRGTVEKPSPLMMAGSKEAATSEPAAKTPPQPGMVWVNTETGVYHREGDRWYGKTKEGKFMTEADAKQAGYREVKR